MAADATKTYTVRTALKHDGTRYAKGESVKLTQAQAVPLAASGSIGDAKAAKAADRAPAK